MLFLIVLSRSFFNILEEPRFTVMVKRVFVTEMKPDTGQVTFCLTTPEYISYQIDIYNVLFGEQGWRSGESTRLPPMWPGFKSRRRRHMWFEFVVGSLPCSERFFSRFSGLPASPQKPTFPISNSTRNQVDEEPLCGCATCKSLFIYLFLF